MDIAISTVSHKKSGEESASCCNLDFTKGVENLAKACGYTPAQFILELLHDQFHENAMVALKKGAAGKNLTVEQALMLLQQVNACYVDPANAFDPEYIGELVDYAEDVVAKRYRRKIA